MNKIDIEIEMQGYTHNNKIKNIINRFHIDYF